MQSTKAMQGLAEMSTFQTAGKESPILYAPNVCVFKTVSLNGTHQGLPYLSVVGFFLYERRQEYNLG